MRVGGAWRKSGLHVQGGSVERVWPPRPGARSTSSIESLALLAAGLVMPIDCYQIMFSSLYICIISVHVCMHNMFYCSLGL